MTQRARRGAHAIPALATALGTVLATALATVLAATIWSLVAAAPAAAATPLVGTFTLTPGSCSGGSPNGTYLRMILPSGGVSGPYMSNSDSKCADQSYTPLSAGTDGGLISGSYQPTPQPPFDKNGNALAGRITAPSPFYGTSFATSSNGKDPQTGRAVPAPQVYAAGSTLTADLRAFSVTWNSQYFNQGAPKPDGTYPGNTRPAHGTYDAASGAFTLDWTSQVVGGPFDKFTGQWHLAGRFVPAGSASSGGGTRTAGGTRSAGGGVVAGTNAAPTGGGSTAGPVAPGGALVGAAGAASGRIAPGSSTSGNRAASAVPLPAGAQPAQQLAAASTTTVTRDRWHVAWWVIALTVALAIAGFVTIGRLNRALRPAEPR